MRNTEKAMKAYQDYIESLGDLVNDDNIDEYTQKFIQEYNQRIHQQLEGNLDYSDEEKAYDLYEEAMDAMTEKESKKLFKQALQLKPDFLDAKIQLVLFHEDIHKRIKELEKLEKEERKRLEKEGYFKDDIGHFYGILDTRPYIRLLNSIASHYQLMGAYKKAMEIYEHMITLNEHDNTGARYSLMGIYATLEEKEKMEKLVKEYPEDSIPFHLFQSVLDFKTLNYTKAKKHIRAIQSEVPEFEELFNGELDAQDFMSYTPNDYYSPYSLEEILLYMSEFVSLFTNDYYIDFIIDNLQ